MSLSSHLAHSVATDPSTIAAVEAFTAAALADADHKSLFRTVLDEVGPSLATVEGAGRGMFGSFANHRKGRRTAYMSELERKCLLCLQADPTIRDVWEQPPAMTFIKPNGKAGTHRWDGLTVGPTGERQYIYIKPLAKLMQLANNRYAEFLYLASWADPAVATSARVMSEWNLDPADVDTAEVYNQALRSERPLLADWVTQLVVAAGGHLLVDTICRRHVATRAEHPGIRPDVRFHSAMSEAYWAILWLLASGELAKSEAGFISTSSIVHMPGSA